MQSNRNSSMTAIKCALLSLCLILAGGCEPALTPQAPETTPAVTQPGTSQPEIIRLKTAIMEWPSGTINTESVTFTWGTLLSSTNPSELTYSTFLKDYDYDYSPFTDATSRTISRLANGQYTFYVKAKNLQGQIEPEPASRSFTIDKTAGVQVPQTVTIVGGLLVSGSNINQLAVASDGITVYALDSAGARLYRSDTAGAGWIDISKNVGGGGTWLALAVAPDDASLVAVSTNAGKEVYISADRGATFSSTNLSGVIGAPIVTSMDISPGYGSPTHEIAVGTGTGAAGGSVFINLTGFASGWIDVGSTMPGWTSATITGIDVFAVKYSPSFGGDGTLLAVASSAAQTFLYSGVRDLGARTMTWNAATGYPFELCASGATTPGTPLNNADITLPADFDGNSPYSGHIFASWTKTHVSQDVYHIMNGQIYRMFAPEAIYSIAYSGTSGRGKLLAGAYRCKTPGSCFTIQTYFIGNPTSTSPSWQPSQKPPTGTRNAQVAWSPDGKIAYAGTTGTESAVSHSLNNGYTWNQ